MMSVKEITNKQMRRVGAALERNRIAVHYAETKAEVPKIVEGLLAEGMKIASGGSMSLAECGVMDLLKSGKYHYLDRSACPPDRVKELYREAFTADAYLCSANAVTENGEIYNVDGNSNRVAAICYGPDRVILVVGCNKLVRNMDEAVARVRQIAAPANTVRLDLNAGCRESGRCVALAKDNAQIGAGCYCENRICCNYVVTSYQRFPGRIQVILVGEPLGY